MADLQVTSLYLNSSRWIMKKNWRVLIRKEDRPPQRYYSVGRLAQNTIAEASRPSGDLQQIIFWWYYVRSSWWLRNKSSSKLRTYIVSVRNSHSLFTRRRPRMEPEERDNGMYIHSRIVRELKPAKSSEHKANWKNHNLLLEGRARNQIQAKGVRSLMALLTDDSLLEETTTLHFTD